MIIIMTKEYTNQMTHSVISYHLLAHVNHWAVVAYHIPPNSPGFMIQHDNIWHGISPWPVCVICPGSVPSNFLVHPRLSHCQGGTRRWKVFGSVQAIKEKKNSVLSALFTSQNITPYQLLGRKINISAEKRGHSETIVVFVSIATLYVYFKQYFNIHLS